jgi:hypothetical protein
MIALLPPARDFNARPRQTCDWDGYHSGATAVANWIPAGRVTRVNIVAAENVGIPRDLVTLPVNGIAARWSMEYRGVRTGARACEQRFLLSIPLSIDNDIIRHPGSATTADHAVRQRFTDFLPDFLLPFGRLISVRSVVQLYPGP